MITSITLENLGCFDDGPYTAEFEKLTVLVGPNNSGKSTLFKGMNFVRTIPYRGMLWDQFPYYFLRDYYNSVYAHDETRKIKIKTKHQIGSDSFETIYAIQGNAVLENELLKNGTKIGNVSSDIHKTLSSKIWYFSPTRSVIPFSIPVGQPPDPIQPLSPNGQNLVPYLLEQFTSRHPNWDLAQEWLSRIDPQMKLLKTPLRGNLASTETTRNDQKKTYDVNLNLQGGGLQNAATIVAAVLFSPENSTVIIEEPENFLHYKSVEILLDLFNFAVNALSKQIIITTHSWDLLMAYSLEIGLNGIVRTTPHIPTNPKNFRLLTFRQELTSNKIKEFEITKVNSVTTMDHFKNLI